MKSKLKKCKVCGAEIAKSANVCPHCGANLAIRKPGVIIGLVIWIIAMVCFMKACGVFDGDAKNNQSASAVTTESTPAAVGIAAPDLWQAYSDNEVNADNLYKNKLLAVTGTITDIGKDVVTGYPCVSLNSGSEYSLYPVQCFFTANDESSEVLAALTNGQEITIYGTCDGTPITSVQLSDCYLAN